MSAPSIRFLRFRVQGEFGEFGVQFIQFTGGFSTPINPRSREKKSGCLFLAESLGCSFQQVEILARTGFD